MIVSVRLLLVCYLVVACSLSPKTSLAFEDLLVGDWASHSVFRVDGATGAVTPFVTSGSGGLNTPDGLSYGPDGNLYVSSALTSQVLRFDGQTGDFIDVFASTNINRAGFLSFGPDGMLYVCNSDGRITRHDGVTGAFVDVFAQDPNLSFPVGLAWRDDHVYVTDFSAPGAVVRLDANTGDFVDVFATEPAAPIYPVFDDAGNLLIADYGSSQIFEYAPDGSVNTILSNSLLSGPVGLLELEDGSLFVTSWNNGRMIRFDRDTGNVLSTWSGITNPNDVIFFQSVPEPGCGLVLVLPMIAACVRRSRRATKTS